MAWPSDVTMQTTTSAALAHALVTYYEKRGLERLLPRLRFAQFADKKSLPKKSGQTVQWYRYRVRQPVRSNLTQMTVPTRSNVSSDVVTASLIQRGNYVALSDLADMTMIDPTLENMSALMGEEAARSWDDYIKVTVTGQVTANANPSSVTYAPAATGLMRTSTGLAARIWTGVSTAGTTGTWRDGFPLLHNKVRLAQSSTVVSIAGSAMSVKTILHAAFFLRANNAMTMDDGKFVGIIHPANSYQLTISPAWKSWHQYTTPEAMYRGEIGEIGGVRFVESTDAPNFALSGDTLSTGSGTMYLTPIFGKHAYGLTEPDGGFKVYTTPAGGPGDPIHQINTIGWKFTGAARLLNKSSGVLVVTTSTAALGC